jgi:hypothetical protein
MDGTTEPIIVVIGHPIAGNPSQFAVEKALRAMKLDWRVLSFDVKPEDVAAALEGFSVTGIAGVLIDPSVAAAASQWYADKTSSDFAIIDCLYRDDEQQLLGSFEQQAWVDDQISQHAGEQRIWLGDTLENAPLSPGGFGETSSPAPPELDVIENADLIAITGSSKLEAEDWPENDGSTLIIDLTEGHPDQQTLKDRGYRVVATPERQIGTLLRCLQRWTGDLPPADVVHDAIEEYLGV